MKSRKWTCVLLVAIVLLLLTACGTQSKPAGSDEQKPAPSADSSPIRIGVVASTTGNYAAIGQEQVSGIKMAAQEWNDKGGIKGRQIEVVVEDDASTPTGAVNALNKLMSAKAKPVAILAPTFSQLALAMEPALNKEPVPLLTAGTSPALTDHNNPWIFRIRTSDLLGAKLAVKYAVEEMQAKKPALIYVNNDYGLGGKGAIEQSLKAHQLQLVATEAFNAGDKDVTAQLLKLKKAEPDVLIAWSVPDDAARISLAVRQLGLNVKLFGSSGFGTEDYLKLAKDSAEGITVVLDSVLGHEDKSAKWIEDFKKRYGSVPATFVGSTYYDGANLLLTVVEKAGTDPKAVQGGLKSIQGFSGVTSEYSFDPTGNSVHQLTIAKWQGGKLMPLKTLTEGF